MIAGERRVPFWKQVCVYYTHRGNVGQGNDVATVRASTHFPFRCHICRSIPLRRCPSPRLHTPLPTPAVTTVRIIVYTVAHVTRVRAIRFRLTQSQMYSVFFLRRKRKGREHRLP